MSESLLRITVTFSPESGQVIEQTLQLPEGSCVQDALQAAGLAKGIASEANVEHTRIGIWGRKCMLEQPLRDLDRVELYRPLQVDPKVARRERFAKQGARTSGLFAQKRAGAKAGY